MKQPEDTLYLEHICECIELIQAYVKDVSNIDGFLSDRKTQDAVLRNLQVMAESTQHLSTQVKMSHAEIAWSSIAGLRNILVHAYLGVNLTTVWRIINNDLPVLLNVAKQLLAQAD